MGQSYIDADDDVDADEDVVNRCFQNNLANVNMLQTRNVIDFYLTTKGDVIVDCDDRLLLLLFADFYLSFYCCCFDKIDGDY